MGAIFEDSPNEMPEQLRYLYDVYMSVRFDRIPSNDTFSLSPRESLTTFDLDYYSKTTGLELERWEVSAIFSMDSIYNKYCG